MLLSYLSGGYVTRYGVTTVIGLSLFLGFTACRGLKADRRVGAMLLLVFGGWFVLKSMGAIRAQAAATGTAVLTVPLGQPLRDSEWMRALRESSLPILVTPTVFFTELQHDAPSDVKRRIVYGTDVELALKYDRITTGDVGLILFSSRLPLNVMPLRDFLSRNHHHFLICAEMSESDMAGSCPSG